MNGVGPCSRPITVACEGTGHSDHAHAIRCGTRQASKCESCSELYQQDARAIIYAGLDETRSFTFITLTAPSFGAVHLVPKKVVKGAAARVCRCGLVHAPGDDLRGVPLDMGAYDYDAAALWNLNSGKLWDRFKTRLNREYGSKLQYLKVAEWQERGSIHLHVLVQAVVPKATVVKVAKEVSTVDRLTGSVVVYGSRVDVQLVAPTDGGSRRSKLGGYIAKLVGYVAKDLASGKQNRAAQAHFINLEKAAEKLHHERPALAPDTCRCGETSQWIHPVTGQIFPLDPSGHPSRYCGNAPGRKKRTECKGVKNCSALLHRQAGYRGHVLTKSRGWAEKSFKSEREARRAFQGTQAGQSENEAVHLWAYAPGTVIQYIMSHVVAQRMREKV